LLGLFFIIIKSYITFDYQLKQKCWFSICPI